MSHLGRAAHRAARKLRKIVAALEAEAKERHREEVRLTRLREGYRRERTCERKHRYVTLAGAERVAAGRSAKEGIALRAYPCDFCGGAHITKQEAKHDE